MVHLSSDLKKLLLPCIFLFFISFILYINILPNTLFFDDEELIYKNAFIQNISYFPKYFVTNMVAGAGKVSNMYRPVLTTSFALDYLIWKLNPVGYHLTSILLHTGNTLLVFVLIYFLFKNRFLAFLTSLFFCIHPVQNEAVMYASGRTDPLFTFFTLLSLFLLLLYLYKTKTRSVVYLLSLAFFLLSLLSKESAVMMPFLFLLTYLVHRKSNTVTLPQFVLFIPYFIFDGFYILLRLTVFNFQNTLNFYNSANAYSTNVFVRIYTFAAAFFQYFGVLFFPVELISSRNITILTSFFSPMFVSFVVLFLTAFFISYYLYKKNKTFLFCFLWFFIALLPSSGIIPINNIAAEHYLYLPSIGFFLFISYLFSILWEKFNHTYMHIFIAAVIFTISALLCIRTYIRTFDWRDPITFYTISLKQSPNNIAMRQNLAMSYAEIGQTEKAIQEYKNTIALSDAYPNTHHNLANTYKEQKNYTQAEGEYLKALKLDPKFYFSYYGLYDLYKITHNTQKLEAIRTLLQQLGLHIP
jgi:protein O-mannosyl-transferase